MSSMKSMRDSGSVRRKLILMAVSTTLAALVAASMAMLLVDLRAFQRYWTDDLMTQADIMARVTAPALAFNDDETARQNLAVLRVRPQILAAAIYTSGGSRFAGYVAPSASGSALKLPERPQASGYRIEGSELVVFRNIVENGDMVGTVYLRARYGLFDRLLSYGAILGAVMIGALAIAWLVASRLQEAITRPLESVTDVARQVMQQRDFSLRVPGKERGEIGVLIDAFNDMLAEIGRRSHALQEANATLEHEMQVRERAEQALIVADRRKDEFLATLAHELRNPLAPIRTGLAVLKIGKPEQAPRVLAMMERQLGNMVHLIDDLLDVSRISRGMVTLKRARVELGAVIDSAVETSRPLITAASHRFSVTVPGNIVWLDADATRVAQIVSNLLNNAAKYTPRGGQVELVAETVGAEVAIRVIDNGIGIPAAMLPKIFDLFTQVDRTNERSQGGLGVGLALARQLAEMHAGRIEVESPGPQGGSVFTLRLPVAEAVHGASLDGGHEATAAGGQAFRVLVVDDNADAAETLALLLEELGHTTQVVLESPKAVAAALAFRPDVVFLDIGMPHLDGFELARRLRAEPALDGVYMAALSGWGTEEDRAKSQDAGIDRHLTKPVVMREVTDMLAGVAAKVAD